MGEGGKSPFLQIIGQVWLLFGSSRPRWARTVFEFKWSCFNTLCSDDSFTLFVLEVLVIFLLKNCFFFVDFQRVFILEIAFKIKPGKTWKMAHLAEPRNDKNLEKPGN